MAIVPAPTIKCRSEYLPECPYQASIYGYHPSLPANAFFLAYFASFGIINVYLGWRHRTWTFMAALILGCFTEAIGYVGRILLHFNAFSNAGFETQIVCLIIAPAFLSAGIYLTLKHFVLCFGEEYSRFPAKYYTYIFITADILALVLQATGGALAATSNNNITQRNEGNDFLMSGIVWQVFTLIVFLVIAAGYFFRLRRSTKPLSMEAKAMKADLKFRLFSMGLVIAFCAIFTRCCYRIAEMTGGWRNPIQQNQGDFIGLDSSMITLAVFVLTIFHPGYCFPRLSSSRKGMAVKNASVKEDQYPLAAYEPVQGPEV